MRMSNYTLFPLLLQNSSPHIVAPMTRYNFRHQAHRLIHTCRPYWLAPPSPPPLANSTLSTTYQRYTLTSVQFQFYFWFFIVSGTNLCTYINVSNNRFAKALTWNRELISNQFHVQSLISLELVNRKSIFCLFPVFVSCIILYIFSSI